MAVTANESIIDPSKSAVSTSSSLEPNASAAAHAEALVGSSNQTATSSRTPSSTCTPSLAPIPPADLHRAASAAKQEAATADLSCVIASIGDMSVDWIKIAQEQPLDPEFRALRDGERSGLNFKSIDIGRHNLIVDISNGFPRPFIPFASRRKIFDAFHGLGHPGVERTRKAICAKVVWPSIRQDVSQWARECLSCQRAKVIKHVQPPIGDFKVPNRRFQHVNVDLVTLPLSNGFKYLLTAVDRFSRWPIAVPIVDITSESVIDAFTYGWIQHYGVPTTITTDRGSQFSSVLFKQLAKSWGIECLMTTPYHPESNGLVERFHRRLKESLIALGAESPDQWFWRLPCTMLAIRTTLKPDLGASPADLVYGEGLAIPGEALPSNPAAEPELVRQRASALAELRVEVSRLQPKQTSAHRRPLVHIPQELATCTHVFVRRGGVQSSLASPYVGPFRVISRNDVNFKIAVPGRQHEVVAICRVKPAVAAVDDLEENEPPSPPRPGRPPRPPPTQQQRRRNPRRRRPNRVESDEDEAPDAPPAPRRRSPSPTPTPPPASPVRSSPSTPPRRPSPVPSDDEFFGDADPPRSPVVPNPRRPYDDWFSPEPSPPAPQRPPTPETRPPAPRVRLFSRPKPGDFSYQPRTARQPAPSAPAPPQPEAPQRRPDEPKTTFFSKGGRFSRRRPDVNALNQLLREHLELPDASSCSDATSDSPDSTKNGFFAPIRFDNCVASLESRTRDSESASGRVNLAAISVYDEDFPQLNKFLPSSSEPSGPSWTTESLPAS